MIATILKEKAERYERYRLTSENFMLYLIVKGNRIEVEKLNMEGEITGETINDWKEIHKLLGEVIRLAKGLFSSKIKNLKKQ